MSEGPVNEYASNWTRGLFTTLLACFVLVVACMGGQAVVEIVTELCIKPMLSASQVAWLDSPLGHVVAGEIGYDLAFLAALWCGWKFVGKPNVLGYVRGTWNDFRTNLKSNIKMALIGWMLMLGLTIVLGLALMALGAPKPGTSPATEFGHTLHGAAFLVFALTTMVAAPICEEVICRGFMLNMINSSLNANWSKYLSPAAASWLSIIISGAFFSIMHLSLAAFFPLFAAGIALGWVYVRGGNIYASMTLHCLMNTLATLAMLAH